jgi:hypothetical protein
MKTDQVLIALEIFKQAFEESRYFRRFHHTIMLMVIPLYSALLGAQVALKIHIDVFKELWGPRCVVVFLCGFFLFLLLVLILLIFRYHIKFAERSVAVNMLKDRLKDEIENFDLDSSIFDGLFFAKYRDVYDDKKCYCFTGWGHWFFIIILSFLTLANIITAWKVYYAG